MPEGSSSTATLSIPADASIPEAIDSAPPAQGSTATDAQAGGGNDEEAQLDAAFAAIKAGKSRDEATAAYAAAGKPVAPTTPAAAAKPEASTPADSTAAAGTTPAAAAVQPEPLAPEHRDLLSRFKIRDSSFVKLDAAERAELLANLKERHDAQARMYQDNVALTNALKGQRPAFTPNGTSANPAAPAAPAQAPASADPTDPYATIDTLLAPFLDKGQSLSAPMKAALQPILDRAQQAEQRAQQAEAATTAFWQHVEAEHKAEGLKAVKVDGVSLDLRTAEGKANHEKLLAQAGRLIRAAQQEPGWNPYVYGWKEAISEAFPSTFKTQTILAQRKSAAQVARQTALRGGDPGGLPNRSNPREGEDAVLDRILTAQREGATREELIAIGAGRS